MTVEKRMQSHQVQRSRLIGARRDHDRFEPVRGIIWSVALGLLAWPVIILVVRLAIE